MDCHPIYQQIPKDFPFSISPENPTGKKGEGRYLPLQDDISSVAYWYSDNLEDEYPEMPSANERELI